ncbi:MAG: primosomal protein N' [Magnetococcales bacterium]|nr:primosomal protein N' [Magnetococcales bacterium]
MFVEIALPGPLNTFFTYSLPESLHHCQPGSLALVPVGRGQRVGVVWHILEQPQWTGGSIRPILDLLSPKPLFDAELMDLLEWISRYYLCPIGLVIAAAMPSHLRFEAQRRVHWVGDDQPATADSIPLATLFKKQKSLTLATLKRHMGSRGLEKKLQTLEKQGIVRLETRYRPRHAHETTREPVTWPAPGDQLHQDQTPPSLNAEQHAAVEYLTSALKERIFRPFLLEGVTGSGKTEVYFRIVETCLDLGRQVLMLVPEIGLTPQMVQRYRERFRSELALFHSGMGDRQRFDAWQNLRSGRARVVIGTRSALFAPFPDLGLVIVDEEHDTSYKQEGSVPYHGRDMAVVRARRAGALLILGSATPSMESLYNAQTGRFTHLKLNHRATGATLPTIRTIHLGQKENQRLNGKHSLISRPLEEAVRQTLDSGFQTLLFLNRRGWAPSLLCHRCGHAVMCPNCSVTLTWHEKKKRLICHYCDHRQPPMDVCPDCGQLSLFFFGPGTEQLEQETRHCFPKARIVRIDRDSVGSREIDLEHTLKAFHDGALDILVGTQMTAKGHHFPRLALVGIVLAESALWQPDFRAAERTCQLLTQVAGRAGREEVPGRVLIQTFDPDHYALAAVVRNDRDGFITRELALRREIGYPPFQRLALLRFSSLVQEEGEHFGRRLMENLTSFTQATLLGPAPSPLFKLRGRFRWQLLIKENPGTRLHESLAPLLGTARSLATKTIRIDLDVDPHSFL